MIINVGDYNGNSTEILGNHLRGLIKRAIKDKKYSSVQNFFNELSIDIAEMGIDEKIPDIAKPTNYNKYLNGSVNMKIELLKQICKKLDCSADYLLGLTPFNKSPQGTIYILFHNIDNDIEITEDLEDYNKTVITYKNKKIIVDNDDLVKDINHILKFYLYDKTHKED